MRLSAKCTTESLRVGSFVVLEGERNRYFSLITDMRLRVTDAGLAATPPIDSTAFVRKALANSHTYATVEVQPQVSCSRTSRTRGSRTGAGAKHSNAFRRTA